MNSSYSSGVQAAASLARRLEQEEPEFPATKSKESLSIDWSNTVQSVTIGVYWGFVAASLAAVGMVGVEIWLK